MRSTGDPILFLNNPNGMTKAHRSKIISGINRLNRKKYHQTYDPEILTRIAQYDLAERMQSSVPEISDLSTEPEHIRKMYGDSQFARHCLLARRLVEKGVRFVELFNADWDHHLNLDKRLGHSCKEIDQAQTALIMDLKQRGLLEDTLVVWAGEFGRTPLKETREDKSKGFGRDHHKEAFTIWMAGGVKKGTTYGATDELGYDVADKKPMSGTLRHHDAFNGAGSRVSFRFKGLDQRHWC